MNAETDPTQVPLPATPVPGAPLTLPLASPDPLLVSLLNTIQHQGQQLLLLQEQMAAQDHRRPSPSKTPKFSLPNKYFGTQEDYHSFWFDVVYYLEATKELYDDDSARIQFVSGLLEGEAKTWLLSLRHRAQKEYVPELKYFQEFAKSFEEHFMDRQLTEEALVDLDRLTRGKTSMREHLTRFENLAIRAGVELYSEAGANKLLKTLTVSDRTSLRKDYLYKPELQGDYAKIKSHLLSLDKIRVVEIKEAQGYTITIPGATPGAMYDPMDLSAATLEPDDCPVISFAGLGDVKIKWASLPKELWLILKQALLTCKCCLYCRDYIADGHRPGSLCKLKDKNFDELNKSMSTYSLPPSPPLSSSSPVVTKSIPSLLGNTGTSETRESFEMPITIRTQETHALMDSGAQGMAYVSEAVVRQLKLPVVKSEPMILRQFQGHIVGSVSRKTVSLPVKIQHWTYQVEFLVTSEVANGILFGFDFFKKHGLLLDCANKRLLRLADITINRPLPIQDTDLQKTNKTQITVVPHSLGSVTELIEKADLPMKNTSSTARSVCANSSEKKQNSPAFSSSQKSQKKVKIAPPQDKDDLESVVKQAPNNSLASLRPRKDKKKKIRARKAKKTVTFSLPIGKDDTFTTSSAQTGSTQVKENIVASLTSLSQVKKLAKAEKQKVYSAWVPFNNLSSLQLSVATATPAVQEDDPVKELPEWLLPFKDVFDLKKLDKLPEYREDFAMPIDLVEDSLFPTAVPYRMSKQEEQALRETIEEGLRTGKIEVSDAAGGCPVLFVKKPDGSLRMCIDYRKLNAITKPIQAFLPHIDDLIAALPSVYDPLYSKVDLKGAFGQLRVRLGDEDKTTFVTKFGKFKTKVIPFGCRNAPGHFQAIMHRLFAHLLGRGVVIYLDDILIFESDPVKHRELVKEVLQVLKDNELVANFDKCEFEVKEVDFLGYHLSPSGVTMQPGKVEAVKNFPTPKTVKDIQRFLGLCNYYREFIKDYSTLGAPLFELLKKDKPFSWTEGADQAFKSLKQGFSSNALLILPDRENPFLLYTDCSKQALGAALHQRDAQGKEKPIAFYSRTLTAAEKNYPIYDKEMLAIKASLQHWRHLLVQTDIPIKIYCDHKNLTYFKQPQLLNERQARWQEFLADFNFDVEYLPGELNVVADALSRPSSSNDKDTKLTTLLSVSNLRQARVDHDILDMETSENTHSLAGITTTSPSTYEYYTPLEFVNLSKKAARVKEFDLDPASCTLANTTTKIAKHIYTRYDNGLTKDWYGNVFINPPYTTVQGHSDVWIEKALKDFHEGKISSVTMLLRDAASSSYFKTLEKHFAVCFLKERITFWTIDGPCKGVARDKHVLAYLGPHMQHFSHVLQDYGFVVNPRQEALQVKLLRPIVQERSAVSPHHDVGELPSLREQITEASIDDLFELTFFREEEVTNSSELQAMQDPTKTTVANWPVFLFYPLTKRPVPASLPEKFAKLVKWNTKHAILKNGKLYREVEYLQNTYHVPYIPENSRLAKLKEIHDTLGHLSNDSVFDSLRARAWWPMMLKDLKDYQDSCEVCQLQRRSGSVQQTKTPIPPIGIPFYRWGLDFIQDLPTTQNGNCQILVAVDYATRFVVTKATPDRTSKTVARFLFELMVKFGAPHEIITDRANCFQSVLADYMDMQKINHFPTTPYHPNTNGMVERVNGVLGAILTKMTLGTREKWDDFVPAATFILNARKHSTTGYSPFFLAYGINPRLPGDVYPPCVFSRSPEDVSLKTSSELIRLGIHRAEALKQSQKHAKAYAESQDPDRPVRTFQVGEYVRLKHYDKKKFEFLWRGPLIVDSIGPHNSYFLMEPNGTILTNPHNGMYLAPWTVERGVLSEPDPTNPVPSPRSDSLLFGSRNRTTNLE